MTTKCAQLVTVDTVLELAEIENTKEYNELIEMCNNSLRLDCISFAAGNPIHVGTYRKNGYYVRSSIVERVMEDLKKMGFDAMMEKGDLFIKKK